MPLMTLNLIGAGRVGQTVSRLWHRHQTVVIQDMLCRSLASSQAAQQRIGAGYAVETLNAMRPADVWMLAVPDAQIEATAALLAATHRPAAETPLIVFHCSGAKNIHALQPLMQQGWRCASAHCILSFADVETALKQFSGTACALEGDPEACAVLQTMFSTIGAQCFTVASQDKLLYHAAAVFATNFVPVLQHTAEQLWLATGVPSALLPHLRRTLLHNAVHNIVQTDPVRALTGPAARGDLQAIAHQAQCVQHWDAEAGNAYQALSALALRMKHPG